MKKCETCRYWWEAIHSIGSCLNEDSKSFAENTHQSDKCDEWAKIKETIT